MNSVDCILDVNDKYTVLIKRKNEPFKDYWALPGGRQEPKETLDQTVVREMKEETGLNLEINSEQIPTPVDILGRKTHMNQIRTYNSGSDPRGGNTTVYAIPLDINPAALERQLQTGSDAKEIGLFQLNNLPELAFDHKQFLNDYYKKLKTYKNPIPTTDIIIEYHDGRNNGIVLIKRRNPPYGLAIPGGYAEKGITLEQNAKKEAKEETGLDIQIENPGRPFIFSDPNRDPRSHLISATYIAKGFGTLRKGDFDDAIDPTLYTVDQVKKLIQGDQLAFDHAEILTEYLKYRGEKC